MKRKKTLLILIVSALAVTLTGCRVRVISDPAAADTVVYTEPAHEPESPPEEPKEPESPPEEPEEPETPSEETPEETAPEDATPDTATSSEPEPTQDADTTRPGEAVTISNTNTSQFESEQDSGITVTYDSNGGDTGIFTTVVQVGETYGAEPTATYRGYSFDGWWTNETGGSEVTPETVVTETSDHTLYAHWQERRSCIVTFDGNGGRVKSRDAELSISDGDLYGDMPTPIREGYDLLGWFTAPEGGDEILPDTVFSGNDDVTLYAHWEYDPYAFWTFTLQNKTQQVYMCQQVSIYFELQEDNVTYQSCELISATGSFNIAENREDSVTTDDWVAAKNPQVIIKCVSDTGESSEAIAARFPKAKIIFIRSDVLSSRSELLYSEIAIAKELYPDWYTDVELSTVSEELGVDKAIIAFK